MTFNEAMAKLYLQAAGSTLSPFCSINCYRQEEVPCCKALYGTDTYIMFVDKTGNIVVWKWGFDDPVIIEIKDLPKGVLADDRWHMDSWYTDDSPYNVADWYRENGWPIH